MVMKRIPQAFFLALFVFAVPSFAQTQPRPIESEESWKEFSSTEGRFKIALPGDPTENSTTIESSLGKIQRHRFTLMTGSGAFFISYSDLPVRLIEPDEVKKFLDHANKSEVASSKGKLKSVAGIAIDGYPGREYIMDTPNLKHRTKYYLAGQRVYELTVWMPTNHAKNAPEMARSMESIASRFFDSFKINDKPEMGGKTTPESKEISADKKGRVDPGSALKKVAPTYPPEAREALVSGKVQVQVIISEEGQVVEATAISGPELLREAAVQAARQWVFKPTRLDGAPVKVQGILTFDFGFQ
jgi:TonB family protein